MPRSPRALRGPVEPNPQTLFLLLAWRTPVSGTVVRRTMPRKEYATGVAYQPRRDESYRACGSTHREARNAQEVLTLLVMSALSVVGGPPWHVLRSRAERAPQFAGSSGSRV